MRFSISLLRINSLGEKNLEDQKNFSQNFSNYKKQFRNSRTFIIQKKSSISMTKKIGIRKKEQIFRVQEDTLLKLKKIRGRRGNIFRQVKHQQLFFPVHP